jgi:hypothetical protein
VIAVSLQSVTSSVHVQEVRGCEERIDDGFRVGMDRAVDLEGGELRIVVGRGCHGIPPAANECQSNYAAADGHEPVNALCAGHGQDAALFL